MSKSYHETYKDLKGKTRKEIDEMVKDPDSTLRRLAEKKKTKKQVLKKRKKSKALKSQVQ